MPEPTRNVLDTWSETERRRAAAGDGRLSAAGLLSHGDPAGPGGPAGGRGPGGRLWSFSFSPGGKMRVPIDRSSRSSSRSTPEPVSHLP